MVDSANQKMIVSFTALHAIHTRRSYPNPFKLYV